MCIPEGCSVLWNQHGLVLCATVRLSLCLGLIHANCSAQQSFPKAQLGPGTDWVCVSALRGQTCDTNTAPIWQGCRDQECSFHAYSLPSRVQGLAVHHCFFISLTHWFFYLFVCLFNNLQTTLLMVSGSQEHYFGTRVPKDTGLLWFGHWPKYRSFYEFNKKSYYHIFCK